MKHLEAGVVQAARLLTCAIHSDPGTWEVIDSIALGDSVREVLLGMACTAGALARKLAEHTGEDPDEYALAILDAKGEISDGG